MSTLQEYKCPCCGGAVEFDSSIQKMKCPYCETEFDIGALKTYEEELESLPEDDMTWETQAGGEWQDGETDGMKVYICQSCGGEIIGDENTGATSCPYCGNHVVMKGQFSGALKPDYVIPFKLDKKAAKEQLKKHMEGKPLLPKMFKSENHLEEIKGIYVPFWLFDADAEGEVRYKATKVRAWSDSKYDYVETRFYSVVRGGSVGFERIPVDGSSKMPDDLMESIEPYDFSEAVPFTSEYLAGFLADKYDVDAKQSVDRANERIKRSTEEVFAASVNGGYATVMPENSSIRLSGGKAKYALYPVWILNTIWKGKTYTFAMNGQTGKFVGDLPIDKGAYWKFRTIWSIGLAVLVYVVLWITSLV